MTASTAESKPPIPSTAGETFTALYRHASPIILTTLTLGFIALRVSLGNWRYTDLIAPLAILIVWPLLEWTIHVHLLHLRPRTLFGRRIDPRVARTHRTHHENPGDLTSITINLEVFPVVVPLLIGLAWWLFPSLELASGALAMFFALSLHYEFCHFIGHIRWCPPINYYRRRQRMHRLHHYRNERLWWGVSTGLGDWLLGTAPDVSAVERSPTVHNVNGVQTQ